MNSQLSPGRGRREAALSRKQSGQCGAGHSAVQTAQGRAEEERDLCPMTPLSYVIVSAICPLPCGMVAPESKNLLPPHFPVLSFAWSSGVLASLTSQSPSTPACPERNQSVSHSSPSFHIHADPKPDEAGSAILNSCLTQAMTASPPDLTSLMHP